MPPRTLPATQFRLGRVALDADDHILYDRSSGSIYYDRDGTGAAAPVPFARVAPGLALSNTDFIGY